MSRVNAVLELDEGLLFVSMRVLDVRRRSAVTLAVDQAASGALLGGRRRRQGLPPSCAIVNNRASIALRFCPWSQAGRPLHGFCSPTHEKPGAIALSSANCSRWSLLLAPQAAQ